MEENNEDQTLSDKATEEKNTDNPENEKEEENDDTFVYLKSSSIISILIIVIISLVCILATSLLIKTALHSHGITRKLSVYFGFQPNRTQDESILTFWQPKNFNDKQPIETKPAIISSSSSHPPPPPTIVLSQTERKAQKIFRNFILPSLLLSSIFCGILAFYMRLRYHRYPAWGARPKRPKQYVTIELKQAQMNESV